MSLSTADLFETLRDAADIVKPQRNDFREAFDALWEVNSSGKAKLTFAAAVIMGYRRAKAVGLSSFDPAKTNDAIALALGVSLEFDTNTGSLLLKFATSTQHIELLNRLSPAAARGVGAAKALRGQLQSIVDRIQTWVAATTASAALESGIRRICSITVIRPDSSTPARGTGFLIGRNALLTNAHVLGSGRKQKAGLCLNLEFNDGTLFRQQIDDVSNPERILQISPVGQLAPTPESKTVGSITSYWYEDGATLAAWQQSQADKLDFAIICLDEPLGDARGWFDLDASNEASLAGSCHVLHYPGSQKLTYSSGHFDIRTEMAVSRVFHSANTVEGSSGGLVFDDQGRPAALHHAGYGETRYPTVFNAAIPLRAINGALTPETKSKLSRPSLFFPADGLLKGGIPVFGCDDFVQKVDDFRLADNRHLLLIDVDANLGRRQGRSFLLKILAELVQTRYREHFVALTTHQLAAGGVATAKLLFEECWSLVDDLPDDGQADTSECAFYTQELIGRNIAPALSVAAARGQRYWIAIDELDALAATSRGGLLFLNTLIAEAPSVPNLRIVKIASSSDTGLRDDAVTVHQLLPLRDEDLANLFSSWLTRCGLRRTVPHSSLCRFIEGVAGTVIAASGEFGLAELGAFTVRHLLPSMTTHINKRSP